MPTPEQGWALYQAHLEWARQAAERYDQAGNVVYPPHVDPNAADATTGSLAGLPGPVVWSWNGPWTQKAFENRYVVMSDFDNFGYSTASGVSKLTKPDCVDRNVGEIAAIK
ncbi:hypothetical protein EYZ11_010700 [Aspergillus tanneri]|uniref:Uncharacterized protein n=1 Tax=Aspergillus tanneri TaxID=1220188 RepID=A0A4S3J4P9_9EURO|nr:uncharacterized protein ATNIH1004_000581 [Aspergillus tanneri]KAA8651685.1 hypothetical protein ATNIH1004_000581 [Aspergillus tanneri]THC89849.1 hypothetical protein EYZ11_010700 [Aspergillus tanneri]